MVSSEGSASQLPSPAFVATAKSFRAAMRKEDFPEPAWRILDILVWLGYECGRYSALIPKQVLFGILCGKLSKGKISETLDWLEECRVVVRADYEVNYGGRRRWWTLYTLEIPEKWRLVKPKKRTELLPRRVEDSQLVKDAEQWLARLDIEQKELIPPPPSLDELLREDFVDRAGTSLRTVHGTAGAPASVVPQGASAPNRVASVDRNVRAGSPGGNFGEVESQSKPVVGAPPTPMVPQQGTKVETEAHETPPQVPPEGTFSRRVPPQGTPEDSNRASLVPPGGTLPALGSPAGNFTGGKGGSSSSTRVEKESTYTRVEYSSTAVPPEGTPAVTYHWLQDEYIREKLQRKPALSYELVNGISTDKQPGLLKDRFEQLWFAKPQRARVLVSMAVTKGSPNAWLNRAVMVELGMIEMPKKAY